MQQKMLVNINLQDILNNQKAIGICFDNLSDKIELDTILYNFYKNLIYLKQRILTDLKTEQMCSLLADDFSIIIHE